MIWDFPDIKPDDLPGMIILADANGLIKSANAQFLKITGFTAVELQGTLLTSLWSPPCESLSDILRHLEKNTVWQKGIRHLKKDGANFQEVCSISKLSADNGKSFHLLKASHLVNLSDFNDNLTLKINKQKEELKKLKESEESYRNIMIKSPIAIAINRTSDARYMDVNEAWVKRTGFKREDVVGQLSTDLKAYRDLNVRKKLWDEFNRQGYVDDLELAFTNRFGQRLYSLVSARHIRFKGEDCLLYISTKIDTLKAAQKVLAEREQNYRTILDMAPYAITISKRKDGTYLQVNETFTRKSGYSEEEIIGRKPSDIKIYVNPSDRIRLLKIIEKEGQVDSMEIPFRSKDGHIKENLVSMTTFQFQGEDCLISMAVEINTLKETQRALEESESRFRTIFETAADPIFLNDIKTGFFLDVNKAACNHLGYTRSEYLNMPLKQIHSPLTPDPLSLFAQHIPKDKGLFFESLHIRKDGSEAIVEVSSQQMMHQKSPVMLSIVRDVTQRKQTENELAAYRKNLEKIVNERTLELKLAQDKLIKKEKFAVLG